MMADKLNPGGINGFGKGLVNTNSDSFKALQNAIIEHSKDRLDSEKLETSFLSIRFQMESYLTEEEISEIIPAGLFIKKFIEAIPIKNKVFADYIGHNESNLSALFTGRRKINPDLAIKLGKIFSVNPAVWLHIETKNDLLKVIKAQEDERHSKYSLKGLLKQAG